MDLVLGQGTTLQQTRARLRMQEDPTAMLEVADAVAFVEHWRELGVEPGPTFALRMAAVQQRAERHLVARHGPPQRPRRWLGPVLGIAAAAAVFAALSWWDPLGRVQRERQGAVGNGLQLAGASQRGPDYEVESSPVPLVQDVSWQTDVASMRQRLDQEQAVHLREALDAGLAAAPDPLGRYLESRNALEFARLDHELRASASLRREALVRQGGIPAADVRVQQFADAIAGQLLDAIAADDADIATIALAARALIAAGPADGSRAAALHAASGWLAAALPTADLSNLAHGLAAMVEIAALDGDRQRLVAREGRRLVASIVQVDGENWGRRLPELLGRRVSAAAVGDAGRVVAALPGFGVDVEHCAVVRGLLLGALRTRRAAGEDSAALLGAMLYGFADSMASEERERLELQIRRWKPVRLAPDFATVQQMAWGIAPGRPGFTRMQGELRQVAVCPDPLELATRAALCLCLATGYAAFDAGIRPALAAGS